MKNFFPYLAAIAVCYGATTSCNAYKFVMKSYNPRTSISIDVEETTTIGHLQGMAQEISDSEIKAIILQGKDFPNPVSIKANNWKATRNGLLNAQHKDDDIFVVVFK